MQRFDAAANRARLAYHRELVTRGRPEHAAAMEAFEQALDELNDALEKVERQRIELEARQPSQDP